MLALDGGSMGRAGRKSKGWRREPSGKLQRKSQAEHVEERIRIARNQPHRQGLKSNEKTSELAESALGRLNLRGLVSTGQRAAGERFAAIVGKYRTVIEGPRPVRSLMTATASEHVASDEELATVRFDCPSQYGDPIETIVRFGRTSLTSRQWPCQLPGQECVCAERRERYMRAYEAIAAAGRRAIMAVVKVAVRGEEIGPEEIVYLKAGLSAAQRFLGLTEIDS